jgi:hypothetical protein
MEREVIETRGDYRAVIIREEGAHEPDSDFQAAVLSFDGSRWSTHIVAHTDAGKDFESAARRFTEQFGMSDGITILERYARIFHGTRDFRDFGYSYSQDNVRYVVFDSAAMREAWEYDGDEGAKGDAIEWQAYIDGDVYGVGVERARHWVSTTLYEDGDPEVITRGVSWEETEDGFVWGYYGREYAESEALSQLDSYAPKND